jgi:mRNA interferase YafQ
MRRIEHTTQFKRDYKREQKGKHKAVLDELLSEVINFLVNDKKLAPKYRDHGLSGDWNDHRDCHLKPDLLLIYRKPDNKTLQLVRLGSHSELSLTG